MNKKLILIVDDNPVNIETLSIVLKKDYILKTALSGKEALQIIDEDPKPDMILLDIIMPEMDGYEVCRMLKDNQATAKIPIIFITAMTNRDDEEMGLRLGGVDYITKPINPRIVKARVSAQLALHEQKEMLEKRVQEETQKRVENEKLLLHQSRLATMGEMMGAVMHQWSQPLSVLSSVHSSILLKLELGSLNEEIILKKMDLMTNTIKFMSQTMGDFRNYFRPDKLKEEFNVRSEVNVIVSMLGSILSSNDISIGVEIDKNITGYGSANEFKQVVLNLISNAKDAIKEKMEKTTFEGHIRVNAYSADGMSFLSVGDNADGIPVEILEHIFDDYFTTKDDSGTGIGLAMSKMIVEDQMNGKISAVNDDQGACFTVEFTATKDASNG